MLHDQKAVVLLSPMDKCPINFYHRAASLPKFDNNSPSVTRDKEICHMILSW